MINNVSLNMVGYAHTPAANSKPSQGSPAHDDVPGRISTMPNLEQYEGLIERFLSGESAMENPSSMAPLTDDQVALRGLMRAYHKTDTRSLSQVQQDMEKGNKSFFNYWQKNGNGAPMPGRLIAPDGSFVIFNSKSDKDAYMQEKNMELLREMQSVLNAGKASVSKGNGFDVMA